MHKHALVIRENVDVPLQCKVACKTHIEMDWLDNGMF